MFCFKKKCFKENNKLKSIQNEIIEAKFINYYNDPSNNKSNDTFNDYSNDKSNDTLNNILNDNSNDTLLNIINNERIRLNKLRLQLDELRLKGEFDNKIVFSIKIEINNIISNIENLCKIYYKNKK